MRLLLSIFFIFSFLCLASLGNFSNPDSFSDAGGIESDLNNFLNLIARKNTS